MCQLPEKNLSVVIIDDEKEACRNLSQLLHTYVDTGIQIKGMAHNTREAGELIRNTSPDAIFLDIEIPGEDVFRFLEELPPGLADVVFVTAYDEYAIRAFKANAVDYILKPIDIEELSRAIRKLQEKKHYRQLSGESPEKWNLPAISKTTPHQITLRNHHQIEIVDFRDLLYIEANGNYSRVYFQYQQQTRSIMMSYAISEYEDMLPATLFYRIHKSYLVNCLHIKKILKETTPVILLADRYRLPVGRRRYTSLLSHLKHNSFSYV